MELQDRKDGADDGKEEKKGLWMDTPERSRVGK